jgi:hypothetical protein
MSIWMELRCDRRLKGCWTSVNNGPMLLAAEHRTFLSITDLRDAGKLQGWKITGRQAICPSCVKEAARPKDDR